jgi:hypothetical protein
MTKAAAIHLQSVISLHYPNLKCDVRPMAVGWAVVYQEPDRVHAVHNLEDARRLYEKWV